MKPYRPVQEVGEERPRKVLPKGTFGTGGDDDRCGQSESGAEGGEDCDSPHLKPPIQDWIGCERPEIPLVLSLKVLRVVGISTSSWWPGRRLAIAEKGGSKQPDERVCSICPKGEHLGTPLGDLAQE